MKIYNTLTKTVEEFVPHEDGKVNMYTCGPTVYHFAHIGNLRTYIFEDILEKGLRYLGYSVKRVMNITDVGHLTSDGDTGEDKMEKGALREGKTVYEIAKFYTDAFFSDCNKLNIKKPSIVEPASHHIDTYIEMISKMLEDGYAYISNGNVYFDVSKAKDYYQLSGKNPDDLMVGVRDTVDSDSECSGISCKYLGEYLDIHCGGVDNVFPHHTNEIAQSEAYFGHKWCNYWVHGEHLNDQTGKMSKSKGEFLTVSLLEEKGYNPLSYRYFCLGSHYRKVLVFSYDALDQAQNAYFKLKNRIAKLDRTPDLHEDKLDYYQNKFKEALSNDLNTSSMLTLVYDVLKDDSLTDFTKLYLIDDFDKVLSLDLIDNEKEIDSDLESYILSKIEERNQAKLAKNFSLADSIRNELLEKGIQLKDTRDGTVYEIL